LQEISFYRIWKELRGFCRQVLKINCWGQQNLGVERLGEILEIASFVATPLGAVIAVAFGAAAFFYGRWVLSN